MYANSEQGLLETKGVLDVNGNEITGYVSNEGLLSVGQMDAVPNIASICPTLSNPSFDTYPVISFPFTSKTRSCTSTWYR